MSAFLREHNACEWAGTAIVFGAFCRGSAEDLLSTFAPHLLEIYPVDVLPETRMIFQGTSLPVYPAVVTSWVFTFGKIAKNYPSETLTRNKGFGM